jgi:hypothetical protein
MVMPGTGFPFSLSGKQIRDLFRWGPFSPLVLASRHIQSAWVAFEIHILEPLMT